MAEAENDCNNSLSELQLFPVLTLGGRLQIDLVIVSAMYNEFGIICLPGVPEKEARAGTTLLGSKTVLSAIFAQSFIIVNFPCEL